jgi:hypothetical protein
MELATAELIWSPDSTQLYVRAPNKEVLLDVSKKTALAAAPDVSLQRQTIWKDWYIEMAQKDQSYLEKFPEPVREVVLHSAKNVYFSPDKKRLLYTATAPATLPEQLTPGLPSSSTQPEERALIAGRTYIYDREEDKNFLVPTAPQTTPSPLVTSGKKTGGAVTPASPTPVPEKILVNLLPSPTASSSPVGSPSLQTSPTVSPTPTPRSYGTPPPNPSPSPDPLTLETLTGIFFRTSYTALYTHGIQWMPDSKHVLFIEGQQLMVLGYDGTNLLTVYTGPFSSHFVYPSPDGSRLVVLTSFSSDVAPNLYAVEIK